MVCSVELMHYSQQCLKYGAGHKPYNINRSDSHSDGLEAFCLLQSVGPCFSLGVSLGCCLLLCWNKTSSCLCDMNVLLGLTIQNGSSKQKTGMNDPRILGRNRFCAAMAVLIERRQKGWRLLEPMASEENWGPILWFPNLPAERNCITAT